MDIDSLKRLGMVISQRDSFQIDKTPQLLEFKSPPRSQRQ